MTADLFPYCSQCGEPTIRKIPEYDDVERSVCVSCDHVFYNSPNCIVACAISCGEKLLWVKRGIPPREGTWTVGPSGFVEFGETLQDAIIRETREEVAIELDPQRLELMGVGTLLRMNQIYVGFVIAIDDEVGTTSDEATEIAWCSEAEAPWNEMAFSGQETLTRALYAWIQEGRPSNGFASLPILMREAVLDRI